jgi:hypothetical protein
VSYHRAPETIARMTAAQRRRREIEYHERLVRKLGALKSEPNTLDGRILVVCKGTEADARASAAVLAIDFNLYSQKLGTVWITVPLDQRVKVLVWENLEDSPVIFSGDAR